MKLEVFDVEILGLNDHRLASMHPMMGDCEFQSFKEDIKLNGQQEPIKLYKGKIIDGRHRKRAINELAIESGVAKDRGSLGGMIKAVSLPNNTSIDEVSSIINSSEKRRMQTKTQLAAAAFKMASTTPSITNKDAALLKGIPVTGVNRCRRIVELLGSKALDDLIEGKEIVITSANGTMVSTSSIQFIYKTLGDAANKKAEKIVKRRLTDVDADKRVRMYNKGLTKTEAVTLLMAQQNYVNSLIED